MLETSLLLPVLLFAIVVLLVVFFGVYITFKNEEKLKEKLKEQRDLAKAIVASMGEGLLVLGTDYKIKLINPAAEKLLETSEKEAVGQKWAEFGKAYIGDKPIPFNKRSAVISLKKGNIKITRISDDHYYITRSGRKYPVVAITAPLAHNNKVIGIVKVFHDASHEKDIDRMKTEFISLASHQLRTPLSAIKWFIELLDESKSGKLSSEQEKYVKNISFSTERMIDLVNSLLNISRIESGRIMVEPKPTDLLKLVKETVGELKRKMENKSIVFGSVERGGKVNATIIKDTTEESLRKPILENVAKGSKLLTDELRAYKNIAHIYDYDHDTIQHSAREYVRGDTHTNTIEGFWSQLKRSMDGTYHVVSPKYLSSYLGEFVWRYNHRKADVHMFDLLLGRVTLPHVAAVARIGNA